MQELLERAQALRNYLVSLEEIVEETQETSEPHVPTKEEFIEESTPTQPIESQPEPASPTHKEIPQISEDTKPHSESQVSSQIVQEASYFQGMESSPQNRKSPMLLHFKRRRKTNHLRWNWSFKSSSFLPFFDLHRFLNIIQKS